MASLSSSSRPSLSDWRQLPSTPGVYIYKDGTGTIIYVGKAKNLKSRVSSYFLSPTQLGIKTTQLVSKITTLEYIEVGSELEALLLEARLIKKFKPHFNIAAKDDKSPYYIHISLEEFPKPVINHEPKGALVGPFLNSLVPRHILKSFRRVAPYCTSGVKNRRPCLYSHLGLCDPCPGTITTPEAKSRYHKNILRLKRLISGNFSVVARQLTLDMQAAAVVQDFEKAARFRDSLTALNHLLSSPIMPDEYLVNPNLTEDKRQEALDSLKSALGLSSVNRIELFDIAHLSGTQATGAMTVAINGELTSRHYRHFTIKFAQTNSDVDMMREVLGRRLKHTDWPHPDLLVLDGGIPQLSILNHLSSIVSSTYPLPPIIALAKKSETLIIPAVSGFKELNLDRSDPGLHLLQALRDEAHRFSRSLHHKHRRNLLTSPK